MLFLGKGDLYYKKTNAYRTMKRTVVNLSGQYNTVGNIVTGSL